MDLSTTNLIILAALTLVGAYSVVATLRTHLPWSRWRVAAMLLCRLALLAGVAAWIVELRVSHKSRNAGAELVVIADDSPSISPQGRASVDEWVARAERAFSGNHHGWLKVIRIGDGAHGSTAIAEALETARATLPGHADKRILLLSDGRATTRDPLSMISQLKNDDIKVFAVPVEPLAGESLMADLGVAPAAWRNVPVPIEVAIISADAQPCTLTLSIDGVVKDHRDVQLPRGNSTVEMSATFDADGVHRVDVKAQFKHDRLDWNNAVSALVDVPLAPRIIVLSEPPAAATALASVLAANGFQVRLMAPKDLPAQFSCDCIVLANVAAKSMTEPRLAAIERYVHAGGAIVFTGGAKAFAAGGYVGSALEPAFPVLLTPKKEHPPYALAIVMDNSWSMNEAMTSSIGKINIAKEIAIAAMEGLNKGDWVTFVSFDSDFHNIIQPTKVVDLEPLKYEVARIGAFGMTNILGGMQEGLRLVEGMDAPYKHIILISDGKETETGTDYSHLLTLLGRDKVTLTTIGVGNGPNEKLLNTLAFAGKGRYFHAKTIGEIPSAVLQEAKSLDDQLIVPMPLAAHKLEEDPALTGIDVDALPKFEGYNRSRARTHAWTPLVISTKNEPLLARMRYGRGQSLAFLSTAAFPWSRQWIETKKPEYVAFWRQAVISVLGQPHHPLDADIHYDSDGSPVFELAGASAGKFEITRLIHGKTVTAPAPVGSLQVSSADADAVLVTGRGATNSAFGWSRSYGSEFGDSARGVETLKELCRATGGVFSPKGDEPFAPSNSSAIVEIPPTTWLIAAAALLVIEILLRRTPALTALFRRGRRPASHADTL